MKKLLALPSFIILFILASCYPTQTINAPTTTETDSPIVTTAQPTSTPQVNNSEPKKKLEPTITATEISPTPTPDPLLSVYGCEMEIKFVSGPLENKVTTFSVLGRDYFIDKSDKFAVGKGTGLFYEDQQYFILHSSYVRGNVLRPMEAEFLRKYLENWGSVVPEYIKGQIDALVGSEVDWICDGELTFTARINGVVRLSHQASNRLWLEPQQLEHILVDREGLVNEWIGKIDNQSKENFYLGFCGWGPKSIEKGRYTYYRYLISFEPIE